VVDYCGFPQFLVYVRPRIEFARRCSTGCSKEWRAARCLDLFAGSGALGLEALSRGAAEVVFVDVEPTVTHYLVGQLKDFGCDRGQVVRSDAARFLDGPPQTFDLIFLDPPFDAGMLPTPAAGSSRAAGSHQAGTYIWKRRRPRGRQSCLPPGRCSAASALARWAIISRAATWPADSSGISWAAVRCIRGPSIPSPTVTTTSSGVPAASSSTSWCRWRPIPARRRCSPLDERVDLARRVLADVPNVDITGYSGLTVDFARERGLNVIVRGLRAVSDFEFEFQLATMSRHLNGEVETVFLTPTEQFNFISSTLIREIASLGGKRARVRAPAGG